jgi:hypothetical protein
MCGRECVDELVEVEQLSDFLMRENDHERRLRRPSAFQERSA